MPALYAVSPNPTQISLFWRALGGAWQPIAFKSDSLALPFKMTPNTEIDVNGGYRISVHVTEFDPIPKGSVELYRITPSATTYHIIDAVLNENGGDAATPTNSTSGNVTVDSGIRCFDLLVRIDQGNTRGGVYEVTMRCVEFQITGPPKLSKTGLTQDAALLVHGPITHSLPSAGG